MNALQVSSQEVTDALSKACFGESDGRSQLRVAWGVGGKENKTVSQKVGSKEEKDIAVAQGKANPSCPRGTLAPSTQALGPVPRPHCLTGVSLGAGASYVRTVLRGLRCSGNQQILDVFGDDGSAGDNTGDDEEIYRFLKMRTSPV